MLPLLIGLLVAAGPLLNGSWDVWAQSIFAFLVIGGTAAWLCGRIIIGYIPLPPPRVLACVAALALLGSLSALVSPLSAYAGLSWLAWAQALWILAAMGAVSKDERAAVDEAVRAAAWALVLLAAYQRWQYGIDRPYASLLNQNVFAGAALMMVSLAVQRRDWALTGALLLCLWWSRSVGAWLGLAGALVLARRSGPAAGWAGSVVGFICLVALYAKLQTPEVVHRWSWWVAAGRMALDRPLLGFGPGTFAYALPAFQPDRGLHSLFAHEHLLETAAELGLPFALLWAGVAVHWVRRGGPHKRFGATAVLVQSLWDYTLSIPSNLWLFAYFAGSSIPETSRGVDIRARWKGPLLAAVLGAAALGGWLVDRQWAADRLRGRALALVYEGRRDGVLVPRSALPPEAAREALRLLERAQETRPHPEAARLAAELELSLRASEPSGGQGRLLAAAEHLERASELDPFRMTTWVKLIEVYRRLGRPDLAEAARVRCGVVCAGARP